MTTVIPALNRDLNEKQWADAMELYNIKVSTGEIVQGEWMRVYTLTNSNAFGKTYVYDISHDNSNFIRNIYEMDGNPNAIEYEDLLDKLINHTNFNEHRYRQIANKLRSLDISLIPDTIEGKHITVEQRHQSRLKESWQLSMKLLKNKVSYE